ncbi:sensor domain-containing diguanylate cyclase [Acidaminobacter sp. JC074]|uniref:sensor domain-containing diguanylate cyclase n=1 Tax=Acidaminobacter sp. JC074 TaxID=2530199 RepID=UPI001F1119D9|nr:sensor domain-containing diguanylate cyclase [Acidaminobacter sp. JC074]MCH4888204.1 sensor domain-containing diguanylate cyclase [Acidaminobacter sp. JC074]
MRFIKQILIPSSLISLFLIICIYLPILFGVKNPLLIQALMLIIATFCVRIYLHKRTMERIKTLLNRFGFGDYDIDQSNMMSKFEKIFEDSEIANRRLKRMNHALELSITINNLFLKTNDQQSVYDFILSKAIEAIGKTYKGSILLLDQDDILRCISIIGFEESFKDLRIKKEDDFLYKSTGGKVDHSVIIDDVVEFNREVMSEEEFESFYKEHKKIFQTTLSTPIKVDDNFIGVINVDGHNKDLFDEEDKFIMDLFASQLEVAIRNRNLLDEILYLSRYDDLTGVYNRKHFDSLVDSFIKRQEIFLYVIIDVNDLKKVNDEYGHSAGDQLLTIFSQTVRDSLRTTDYFARLGGDEFGMILTDIEKIDASKIFMRIMRELTIIRNNHDIKYPINFSYGITEYPKEASTAEELYLKSDMMMYKMKRQLKMKDA